MRDSSQEKDTMLQPRRSTLGLSIIFTGKPTEFDLIKQCN